MQVLNEMGCKVPGAFTPSKEFAHVHPDLHYFFVEKIGGKELGDPICGFGKDNPEADMPLIKDYARHQTFLAKFSIRGIGSLQRAMSEESAGQHRHRYTVGPLLEKQIHRLNPPHLDKIFQCDRDKYLAMIDEHLKLFREGQSPVKKPLWAYLAHLEVREMIASDERMANSGECYLHHTDDSFRNIMSDDAGHLTGVIDWEWSFTASKDEAFAAPLVFIDVRKIYHGVVEPMELEELLAKEYENLGRPDLADCVRRARRYHLLTYFLGGDPWPHILRSFRTCFGRPVKEEEFEGDTMEKWASAAIARFAEDEGVKQLLWTNGEGRQL